MSRILQVGCFGTDNLGDEMGAQEIRRQMRARWPDSPLEFTMVTRDPGHSARNHPDVRSFVSEDDMSKGRLRLHDFSLVVLGGGTLLGGRIIRSARFFLRLPDSGSANLFIWGCGVDPVPPGVEPEELRRLCAIARCITVRNQRCADYLATAGVTERVHVTADPLFSVPTPSGNKDSVASITLCEKLLRLGWWRRQTALRAVSKALSRYRASSQAQLAFLPMRVQGHRKWRSDLDWANALQRRLPCPLRIIRDNRPETVLNHLARADLYVGTRLHGCLLAALAGCRVIGIGWQEKMGQLFQDLGMPGSLLDPVNLGQPDALDKAIESARCAAPERIAELRGRAQSTVALVEI